MVDQTIREYRVWSIEYRERPRGGLLARWHAAKRNTLWLMSWIVGWWVRKILKPWFRDWNPFNNSTSQLFNAFGGGRWWPRVAGGG